ncbi:peptidase S9 [Gemmatimonadetes bacterium T265]|nr:peptidase S9 [Gemmatimonadetes bacterium T265]
MSPVPRYPVAAFFDTVAYHDASFSRDSAHVLVSGTPTGVFNVYRVPTAGGAPEPLTASAGDATYAVSYFRTDDRVLYTHDAGGDELHHLYVREADGTARDLTPGERLKAGFLGWSQAGDRFYVTTNERDPGAADVDEYAAAAGYARTRLYTNPGAFRPAAVSLDGRYVALEQAVGADDADVYLYDRRTDTTEQLTPHAGAATHRVAAFAADAGALYVTTDEGSEFARLERLDLATRRRTVVLAPPWDVTGAVVAPDGATLAVLVNVDARSELQLFALPAMRPLPSPAPAGATVGPVVFSPDGRRLAFYASASRAPNDLYVADVGSATARRLTHSLAPALDPADLVDARVARFRADDGVDVPGLLYLPHGASPVAPVPAVVMVHGGPGGQARLGWHPVAQLLANHGYAVYDVNNRGSSGYGRTFYGLDVRRQGEADLGDVVAARGLLAATGVVDPARVAVLGASYGGFLVLAALTTYPTAFAAGVDLFGPSDWVRTLERLPAWLGAQRDALFAKVGDPAVDGERLRRVSPIAHADQIRRPLLVLQGANDARVLRQESDEIVAAVRRNGVPVEYRVFPDEGHGFVRRENQLAAYGAVVGFLGRYLPDARRSTDA